jgi:hypothetical protein
VANHRYAVQVVADPNLGSLQVWWYNKSFKDLGVPMIDHFITTTASQQVVSTPPADRSTAEVLVAPGPRVIPTDHLCRDLTAG